jgi:hypothetical protein
MFTGTYQMSPHLLLHPVSDHGEAPARIANPKVVHPTSQDRIDRFDHVSDRLAAIPSEDFPEFVE